MFNGWYTMEKVTNVIAEKKEEYRSTAKELVKDMIDNTPDRVFRKINTFSQMEQKEFIRLWETLTSKINDPLVERVLTTKAVTSAIEYLVKLENDLKEITNKKDNKINQKFAHEIELNELDRLFKVAVALHEGKDVTDEDAEKFNRIYKDVNERIVEKSVQDTDIAYKNVESPTNLYVVELGHVDNQIEAMSDRFNFLEVLSSLICSIELETEKIPKLLEEIAKLDSDKQKYESEYERLKVELEKSAETVRRIRQGTINIEYRKAVHTRDNIKKQAEDNRAKVGNINNRLTKAETELKELTDRINDFKSGVSKNKNELTEELDRLRARRFDLVIIIELTRIIKDTELMIEAQKRSIWQSESEENNAITQHNEAKSAVQRAIETMISETYDDFAAKIVEVVEKSMAIAVITLIRNPLRELINLTMKIDDTKNVTIPEALYEPKITVDEVKISEALDGKKSINLTITKEDGNRTTVVLDQEFINLLVSFEGYLEVPKVKRELVNRLGELAPDAPDAIFDAISTSKEVLVEIEHCKIGFFYNEEYSRIANDWIGINSNKQPESVQLFVQKLVEVNGVEVLKRILKNPTTMRAEAVEEAKKIKMKKDIDTVNDFIQSKNHDALEKIVRVDQDYHDDVVLKAIEGLHSIRGTASAMLLQQIATNQKGIYNSLGAERAKELLTTQPTFVPIEVLDQSMIQYNKLNAQKVAQLKKPRKLRKFLFAGLGVVFSLGVTGTVIDYKNDRFGGWAKPALYSVYTGIVSEKKKEEKPVVPILEVEQVPSKTTIKEHQLEQEQSSDSIASKLLTTEKAKETTMADVDESQEKVSTQPKKVTGNQVLHLQPKVEKKSKAKPRVLSVDEYKAQVESQIEAIIKKIAKEWLASDYTKYTIVAGVTIAPNGNIENAAMGAYDADRNFIGVYSKGLLTALKRKTFTVKPKQEVTIGFKFTVESK